LRFCVFLTGNRGAHATDRRLPHPARCSQGGHDAAGISEPLIFGPAFDLPDSESPAPIGPNAQPSKTREGWGSRSRSGTSKKQRWASPQAGYMCELSPNQVPSTDRRNGFQIGICPTIAEHCLQVEPKSLFRNILEASPCESIFYPDPSRSIPNKSLRINILGEQTKKIL
jgi:hypothetical protein